MTIAKRFGPGKSVKIIAALSATALLSGCIPQNQARQAPPQPARSAAAVAAPAATPFPVPQAAAPAQVPPPAPTSPVTRAQGILASRIQQLGESFNGDIGIAVKDVQTGWSTAFDGSTWFPQQSVSKFWVALTALDRADKGQLNLHAPVTLTRDDRTVFHRPIEALIGANGYTTTLDSLMNRAITQSDNTANDFLLWKAGGPEAVRAVLRDKGIEGIRFGPGERLLQAGIAGLTWQPSYSIGNNFYEARSALPMATRRDAFQRYIRDPVDGAKPLAIVDALARLKKGELLSPQSTQILLGYMTNTRTGAQRLKGGLSGGFRLAHKTGTGQVLGGEQAGYNDIGIVTAPDGRSYAVAVMIRRTSAPIPERMRVMQETTRAIIDYVGNMREG